MERLLNNIYKVYRDVGSTGWGYSYLLKREGGNIFLPRMAKQATINDELEAIADAGGIQSIYVTDFHFAGAGLQAVADRFQVPIQCSTVEAPKIRKRGPRDLAPFAFNRHHLEEGWEVIPTPGHTTGGVCFLWRDGEERYLFTGDFLYNAGDAWVVGSDKLANVEVSLALIRTLDFTYLVGCGDDDLGSPFLQMDKVTRETFVDQIISNF
ncbi:MAG: MBL fold metallo-hydrolase [Caldilineaceae bacterium]